MLLAALPAVQLRNDAKVTLLIPLELAKGTAVGCPLCCAHNTTSNLWESGLSRCRGGGRDNALGYLLKQQRGRRLLLAQGFLVPLVKRLLEGW
jgi:hypothetical protein